MLPASTPALVLNSATIIINSVTIALGLVILVLILWQDARSEANVFYAIFMLMAMVWSAGTVLTRVSAYIGGPTPLTELGIRLLGIGFTGSSIGLYLFAVIMSGGQRWRFMRLAVLTGGLVIVYQVVLMSFSLPPTFENRPDGTLAYSFGAFSAVLYISFTAVTLLVAWQRRRKVRGRWLLPGIYGFSIGILIELISPELRRRAIGMDISAICALLISYAMVRAQIIDPLSGRANQLQAVRDVGLAITSRLRLEDVLSSIAGQAAGILQGDGAAIFLNQGESLELAAVHNMPAAFRGIRLAPNEGLAGTVATTRQSMRVEDYRRDWKGVPDTPFAKQSFGSVVAAPLIFADEVMGVLFVAVGSNGKRFDRDELRLLELLGPQAAVAITNSRLFERQSALTGELESAKNQMETLLASTENPVIALNRRFEIIFANPAAVALFGGWLSTGQSIRNLAPPSTMPGDPVQALRELHRRGAYTYELLVRDRTFLCHVALLGRLQPRGYVAVLNDISQLKELDRLKNQMIRMTSHDLKNPLAAAMFHVELLQEEGEEIFTDEMQRDIATIWAQLQRMNRIISGILDLERVQTGTPLNDECAIEKIVQTAVHEFEAQASEKGVELGTVISEGLPMIIGDHQQLTQAVGNLVENAVKFTGAGGKVTVTTSAVDDCVVINVADTGIGIPRDAQSRLFERFYRANHPGVEPVTGTGLGLSLVKAVVDAHKGRIWLESEVGKGTSIHMALPVRQSLPSESRKVTTP